VLRVVIFVLACLLALSACHKNIENKEQVRSDLLQYLSSKVGLDVKALDIDVTKVTFQGDQAQATVSFHQKTDPNIGNGMVMVYNLQQEKDHWVVKGRSDSQGHGFGSAAPNQDLPPGHPTLPPGTPSSQQGLPPGHPSVGTDSNSPEGAPQGQTK
jgi:hypothetical protein